MHWKLARNAYGKFGEEDIEILAVDAFLRGCREKQAELVAMNQEAKHLDDALHCINMALQNQRILNLNPKPQPRQVTFADQKTSDSDVRNELAELKKIIEGQSKVIKKLANTLDIGEQPSQYKSATPPASPAKDKCYRCGKPGHIASKCPQRSASPEKTKCYRCGKEGHMERDCSISWSNSPRPMLRNRSRSPARSQSPRKPLNLY